MLAQRVFVINVYKRFSLFSEFRVTLKFSFKETAQNPSKSGFAYAAQKL
jgi:hypothetical protein